MVDAPTRKERYAMHNSLICLVQALKEHYVTIEMRCGETVSGKLSHVDGYMNMAMDDAVFITADNRQHVFEYFYVQARNIKFVTIPQYMDIAEIIMSQLADNRRRFCHRGVGAVGSKQMKPKLQKKGRAPSTSQQPPPPQ